MPQLLLWYLVHLASPFSSSLSLSPQRSLFLCDAYEGPSQRGRSYGEESHLEAVRGENVCMHVCIHT